MRSDEFYRNFSDRPSLPFQKIPHGSLELHHEISRCSPAVQSVILCCSPMVQLESSHCFLSAYFEIPRCSSVVRFENCRGSPGVHLTCTAHSFTINVRFLRLWACPLWQALLFLYLSCLPLSVNLHEVIKRKDRKPFTMVSTMHNYWYLFST